jgi:hypothetical protein
MDELETKEIKDVEIFAAGTWNGDMYTEKDLEDMVEAFKSTKETIKPFLKLGHNEMQPILAADGLPAAGWISDIRKVGSKLLADFTGVPKSIYELIKAGAYRKVSAEIFWNFACDGKKYPYLLKAVALLGADIPAVSSLADIMSLYAKGEQALAYKADGVEVKTYEIVFQEDTMEEQIKELQEKLAAMEKLFTDEKAKTEALEAEKATLTTEKETLTKTVEETTKVADEAKAKYAEVQEAKRVSEIEAKIDELIEQKKIMPNQKEMLFSIMKNVPAEMKYSVDDKEFGLGEMILKFAEMNQAPLPTEPKGEDIKPEVKSEDEALDEEVRKFMAERKVSYRKAYAAITLEKRLKAAEGKAGE